MCDGEESRCSVEELDSVWWEGRVYQEGEELVFTEKGDFTLTGYMNGCAAEKEIAVEVISDPAADYYIRTELCGGEETEIRDRKTTRLNSSHVAISYAVFCLKKKRQ